MKNVDKPKIKIYIACHKPCHIPKNDLLFPIQVGAAISNNRLEGMLHDDEGDNISAKNKSYCELTAQYWAWKNDEADYYGFFHYRRYFSFSATQFPTNPFGEVLEQYNDDETLKKYSFSEKYMADTIGDFDLIIPTTGGFVEKDLTMYKQYEIAPVHKIEDLEFVLNIIKRDYPEMYPYAKKYLNQTQGYFCNMFIMKRELFFKYSEWLFAILKEHEENTDISDYSDQAYRVHGFLAERLCGIYLYWLEHTTKLKILKLQRVFFQNVDREEEIFPAFEQRNVPVVLSANDYYVPFLSTILQSIKDNSSADNNYDILILNTDISKKNQNILKEQLVCKNFSVRFVDVRLRMRKYSNLPLRGHFRIETYFRILMPEMLPNYNKMLYLDSDMIVCADVAELYKINTDGYLLAACKDADTAGLYNGYEPNKKTYMDTILRLKEPYKYFQAGTILFNLEEFRKTYTVEEMMDFAMSYQWELLDQDVLNYLAQGKTKFIDMAWNVMMDWRNIRIKDIISLAPRYLYQEYMNARKHPKIIHYAGPDKPWDIPYCDFAEVFWHYAKKTPFYEIILLRMFAAENGANLPAYIYNRVYPEFSERIHNEIKQRYNLKPSREEKKKIRKEKRSARIRKIADKFFPAGSARRKFVKKLLGIKAQK